MSKENDSLDEVMSKVDLSEKTELGEVTKEFSENKPSSSNLTSDEQKLIWRAKAIILALSPDNIDILNDYVDSKRSVLGWNTIQKVAAITGVQNQRQGLGSRIMDKMFSPRPPGT